MVVEGAYTISSDVFWGVCLQYPAFSVVDGQRVARGISKGESGRRRAFGGSEERVSLYLSLGETFFVPCCWWFAIN